MSNRKRFCLAFTFILTTLLSAQERGYLEFRGKAIKNGIPLNGATITLLSEGDEISQIITEKKGKFSFDIDFGRDYQVNFFYPGSKPMHLLIFASSAPDGKPIFPVYQTEVPFHDDTTKYINLEKYKHPFTKVIFDGTQMFMDDEQYLDDFAKGIFPEEPAEDKKTRRRRKLMSGRLQSLADNTSIPVEGVKIHLIDAKGNIVETAETNSKGAFVFSELPADGKALIRIDEKDAALYSGNIFVLTDKEGRELVSANNNEKVEFNLLGAEVEKLSIVDADDTQLESIVKGTLLSDQKTPMEGIKLSVISNGSIIASTVTDSKGNFQFKNLPPDAKIIIAVDENDTKLAAMQNLFFADEKGAIVKECPKEENKFNFSMLPEEQKKLSYNYIEDDTKLIASTNDKAVNTAIKGILLSDQKAPIEGIKLSVISNGNIIATSTTDSQGKFQFENLPPDAKIILAVDENDTKLTGMQTLYFADEKGSIVKECIKEENKFNFSMLPEDQKKLSDNYTEEDTQLSPSSINKNLKTEVKGILLSEEKSPIVGARVLIIQNGSIIATTLTDSKGRFYFKNLPPDIKVILRIEEDDTHLAGMKTIFFTNEDGTIIKQCNREEKKGFTFRMLPEEENKFSRLYAEADTDLKADSTAIKSLAKGILLSDQKTPIVGAKLSIVQDGKVIASTITDSQGRFYFKNLPSDAKVMIIADENDTQLSGMKKIFFADDAGAIVRECTRGEEGFTFALLPEEQTKIRHTYSEDDTQLAKSENIQTTGKRNYPDKFSFADINKDNIISANEVRECVDSSRSGNSSQSTELIYELIEWYLG